MQELISTYGYPAIFVGCLLEGETIVVLGGIAAKLGYLNLGGVILAAWMGTVLIDQALFQVGRRYGQNLIARWPTWQMRAGRVHRLLEKYDLWFIVGFRFLYGLRTVSPVVIGMSRIATARFLFWDVIAAALWAVLVATVSYAFGQVIQLFLQKLKHYELFLLGGVAAAGLLFWIVYHVRLRAKSRRHLKQRSPAPSSPKPLPPA